MSSLERPKIAIPITSQVDTSREIKASKKDFLDLPTELRVQTYKFVVEEYNCGFGCKEISFEYVPRPDEAIFERQPPLAQVCRTTRNELLPIYYGQRRVFVIEKLRALDRSGLPAFERWANAIGDYHTSHIKNVRVESYQESYGDVFSAVACFELYEGTINITINFQNSPNFKKKVGFLRNTISSGSKKFMAAQQDQLNKWNGNALIAFARSLLGRGGALYEMQLRYSTPESYYVDKRRRGVKMSIDHSTLPKRFIRVDVEQVERDDQDDV